MPGRLRLRTASRDGPPAGRLIGQLHLLTQATLDQLKEEAGHQLNLPDLGVGSLRGQARDYLRELVDIDEQMAESQRERQRLRCSCRRGAGTSAVRP